MTVSSAIRGNVGPVPAKVDTKGNQVEKRAEKGLVVWEEAAELSGPRRRAWRKLKRACDDAQRCGSFLPHQVGISRTEARPNLLVMCAHLSGARHSQKRFIVNGESRRFLNCSLVGLLKMGGKLTA